MQTSGAMRRENRECLSSFRGARSASYDVQLHIRNPSGGGVNGEMDSGPAPKRAHPQVRNRAPGNDDRFLAKA